MKLSTTASILLATVLISISAGLCLAQTGGAAAVGPRVLPSVAELKVQRGDKTAVGTAFVAVKDGVVVTALHVLRDATKVTVTFASGEEFEGVGLIDKDERRNLALVRIRAFGRPVLKIAPGDLAVGEKVFVPVVKDGAFGIVEASVSEPMVQGSMKSYRLSGEIPDGNNGSPVVNAAGEVVGVHLTLLQDGRGIELALPAAYIQALEPSLPVQPWTKSAPAGDAPGAGGGTPAAANPPAASPATDAVDTSLAAAMLEVREISAVYTPLSQVIYRLTRYTNTKKLDLYSVQSRIDAALSQVTWLKPADPLRQKLVQAATQLLARERQAIELDLQCWLMNKDVGPGKHIPQAEDAARRATALFEGIPLQVVPLQADFRQLAQDSPAFLKALLPELRYFLGVEPRKSKLLLGVYVSAVRPMQILGFASSKVLADELGLQSGDIIVSAGGRDFKLEDDMEDFKLMLEQRPGATLDVVVNRGSKPKALKLKVPADLMQRYSRSDAPQQ